ncbi:hypothetical protein ACFE04_002263 [Oxalis oulophora]
MKSRLRENCFKRLREDRSRLLWKLRTPNENFISSAFRDIVSDELEKINNASASPSAPQVDDDILWKYDGLHHTYQGDCEEILIEMQRIFYEDLQQHSTSIDSESQELTWEDEEDEYLARAVYEHMQLNGEQNKVWCPICKQGELQENKNIINCTLCELKLNKADEVNLGILKDRLAELHAEHFDRGCRLTPKFCIEDKFDSDWAASLFYPAQPSLALQAFADSDWALTHEDCIAGRNFQFKWQIPFEPF